MWNMAEMIDTDLEKGIGANKTEVVKQADIISEKWSANKQKSPVVIMLGGFQGSGKTTVADVLAKENNLVVISPDEIRFNLFDQGANFSEDFVRLVNATKYELLDRCLGSRYSVIVDQAITPTRVKIVRELLNGYPDYKLVSIFLTAPEEILKKRVSQRPEIAGKYRGTAEELKESIRRYAERYGDPVSGGYDLIIDTEKNDLQEVAIIIKNFLK
jgi:cytidylate kinase